MKISDIMTCSVLSVPATMPVRLIAQLLTDHGISALPVVEDGRAIGIVSETDLVLRASSALNHQVGWLAALLRAPANAATLGEVFRADLTARDIMTSPVIAVSAEASLQEGLHLMVAHGVKRLPVLNAGRLCGIISRPDVLRALSKAQAHEQSAAPQRREIDPTVAEGEADDETAISAAAFRDVAEAFRVHQVEAHVLERRHDKEEQEREISQFLEQHLTVDFWRSMLLKARAAATHGATEVEVLRFPCGVCSDAGRAINNSDSQWTQTLRGLPSEIYQRTEADLRPKGFRIKARILDFPDGIPGHIGLFLSWSKF